MHLVPNWLLYHCEQDFPVLDGNKKRVLTCCAACHEHAFQLFNCSQAAHTNINKAASLTDIDKTAILTDINTAASLTAISKVGSNSHSNSL